MAKLTLSPIGASYRSIQRLNANFDAIEAAVENTLSRDGTTPNSMGADFDMNGYRIINYSATPVADSDLVNKAYVDSVTSSDQSTATTDSPTFAGLTVTGTSTFPNVVISGGTLTGVTITNSTIDLNSPLLVSEGGTGSTTAAGARTNLGVQEFAARADLDTFWDLYTTIPSTRGPAGTVLSSDGLGNLLWVTQTGGSGGGGADANTVQDWSAVPFINGTHSGISYSYNNSDVNNTMDVTILAGTSNLVNNSVTSAKIAPEAVTLAKVQQISGSRVLGNSGGSNAVPSQLDEATFKTMFNLETGVDVQAYDSSLSDIAALDLTGDKILVTNSGVMTAEPVIGSVKGFLQGNTLTLARQSINLEPGEDIQAFNSSLTTFLSNYTLPSGSGTSGQVLVVPASGQVLEWADQSGSGGGSGDITSVELSSTNSTIKFDQGASKSVLSGAGVFDIEVDPVAALEAIDTDALGLLTNPLSGTNFGSMAFQESSNVNISGGTASVTTLTVGGIEIAPGTTPSDNQVLAYDTATNKYIPQDQIGGGGGGSQNVFSTIAVTGQGDISADSATDTLTLVGGTNVTLGINQTTDTITINAATIADDDYGDITVSNSGATWTIDNSAVDYTEIANTPPAALSLTGGTVTGATTFSNDVYVNRPADFWSSTNTVWFNETGWIGHNGSNRFGIFANYYRNTDTEMSFMGAGGITDGGSGIEVSPSGRVFVYAGDSIDPTSGANPPLRFEFQADGTLRAATADYENLVTGDDDIPNRKFVTDYSFPSNGQGTINSASDFNNFTTPGWYLCQNFNPGATNGPDGIGAYDYGALHVAKFSGSTTTNIVQVYYPDNRSSVYVRNQYSGSWRAWREVASNVTDNFLPLSGGTVTGNVTVNNSISTPILTATNYLNQAATDTTLYEEEDSEGTFTPQGYDFLRLRNNSNAYNGDSTSVQASIYFELQAPSTGGGGERSGRISLINGFDSELPATNPFASSALTFQLRGSERFRIGHNAVITPRTYEGYITLADEATSDPFSLEGQANYWAVIFERTTNNPDAGIRYVGFLDTGGSSPASTDISIGGDIEVVARTTANNSVGTSDVTDGKLGIVLNGNDKKIYFVNRLGSSTTFSISLKA